MTARMLPDGRRLFLSDGPIDLVIGAWGDACEIRAAYAAARARAATVLDELCSELALLRSPASPSMADARGDVARAMQRAVMPYAQNFITPMAAVAGAVAQSVLRAMTGAARLERAYVNNGGDIALHMASGQSLAIALVDRPDRPSLFASTRIAAADAVCGVATSGWRGRSFSLGIADAVTVLAGTAAEADAAATVVANAVDLPGHPAVTRVAANSLDPASDLGPRLVTRDVAPLDRPNIQIAVRRGAEVANRLRTAGLITAAALHVQGITHIE